jgi:anaerobic selenocysteine-containing dehydrogenase
MGGEVINIEGDPESPINEGTLCPKGNDFPAGVESSSNRG